MSEETRGYIALYRCLLKKPIWKQSTPEQKTILITLLLMANHEENEWEWQGQKFKVFPGQFITSLDSIVKACGKGITTQNVRSALDRFEKYEFLTYSSTKTGRLVTILKWHTYQVELKKGNKATNKEVTKCQQRGNKEVTTNNNDKNDKNDNNLYIEFFESIWSLYPLKKGKGQVKESQIKKLYSIGYEELSKCIERYKQSKEDWKQWQQGSTFFNSGYVDYLDANYQEPEEDDNEPAPTKFQVDAS